MASLSPAAMRATSISSRSRKPWRVLNTDVIDVISDEMWKVVETVWARIGRSAASQTIVPRSCSSVRTRASATAPPQDQRQ